MKIGKFLKPFLKEAEGLILTAVRDQLAKNAPVNVGYGHVTKALKNGAKITEDQADALLDQDLDALAPQVARAIGAAPTLQREFDAMTSLAYNIGIGAFTRSTLLQQHIAGKKAEAADEFLRWKFANGKASEGLLNRRIKEREIYLGQRKLGPAQSSPTDLPDHSSEA